MKGLRKAALGLAEERVIPDAQTVLAQDDELVLLGPTAALEAMKAS